MTPEKLQRIEKFITAWKEMNEIEDNPSVKLKAMASAYIYDELREFFDKPVIKEIGVIGRIFKSFLPSMVLDQNVEVPVGGGKSVPMPLRLIVECTQHARMAEAYNKEIKKSG